MTRTSSQPDVVVVGAGPAGSSAAIRLAQAGCAVAVVEGAVFPRRKVCGGCLSGDAVDLLGELVGAKVASLGTPVSRITFGIGRRTFRTGDGDRCRIVRRDVLDATLAEAADAAGANVVFGARAELVQENGERFSIRAGAEHLQPRWIIWAAGLSDLVSSELLQRQDCRRALLGQAWSVAPAGGCPPVGEIAMHWLRGGYVGLATISPEECLMGMAVERNPGGRKPVDLLRAANPDASILRVMELPAVAPKLGIAGFPHRPQAGGCGNVLVAGDAAGFEEPFSGEGMGQALRSGMAAGEAVLTGESSETVRGYYQKQLRRHRRVRRRTRLLSKFLRNRAVLALAESRLPGLDVLGGRLVRGVHVKPETRGV